MLKISIITVTLNSLPLNKGLFFNLIKYVLYRTIFNNSPMAKKIARKIFKNL